MLYIFTATYPYGSAEGFLEEELLYLSEQFQGITIIPLSGVGDAKRSVPKGCIVNEPILKSRLWKFFHGLFCSRTFGIYVKDLFQNKVLLSRTKLCEWLASYFNTNCAIKHPIIKNVEKSLKEGDICYFYWGKGLNSLSVFWDHKAKYVSRFHGEWDLWEESAQNYAPIRRKIVNHLDLAVFISQKGEAYFKKRYPQCKTVVSRLGSRDCGPGKKSTDGVIRVVSCSSVWWLKRVPLIYQALKEMNEDIEWTHIGTGEDFDKLKNLVDTNKKNNVRVNLTGYLSHDEVLRYYAEHPVDVFINVSTNEGIPVSIMEAISFDIPVIATDVGGNSEVTTLSTGILLRANPSPAEIMTAIRTIQKASYKPRNFWEENYSAKLNYSNFANLIRTL